VSLVVFLKGINVGGHRTFRPSVLASRLKHLDLVSVGAAGTFVVRKRIARAKLRAELARRMPFIAEIIICDGADILHLVARAPFVGQPTGEGIVRFVSVLARARPSAPTRLRLPSSGDWTVKMLGRRGRFVHGLHRREMKAIGQLVELEKIIGGRMATRQWSTMLTLVRILKDD
jgi:uncharacterized protein (DUF1697 family)